MVDRMTLGIKLSPNEYETFRDLATSLGLNANKLGGIIIQSALRDIIASGQLHKIPRIKVDLSVTVEQNND